MSTYNFQSINNATISLGNGEQFNIKKLSVKIDGKLVIENKEIEMKIIDGVLIINSIN